ncbi:hypothetical protein K437DRAFT_255536 [Tilletiaria anomala UBC 951]|uniref:Plus3 domain-containing protein n=1 Tax=Tilletiaria anomala (strain ATCC 24038 / CBS 436.72 / UBC 951) TaxID=1037660 RepID=A0A066WCE1_TILAU|nr:uncharacterized protein K437DRAFT_255536 [Tilletiaria anomala UBC 951]KDN48430.1 hypothetical protein K437DRAFT_255536 [Tilletiaria anomala UBC 951]
MANVDDELLALAGGDLGGGGGLSDRKKDKKRQPAADSDMDEGSSDEDGQADAAGSDMDEGVSDGEEVDVDPFPYRGIYKNEDDQKYIESLPELEREEILASRRDEKSKREQKRSLLAMYQNQQSTSASTTKAAKRGKPSKPVKSTKSLNSKKEKKSSAEDSRPTYDDESETEDSEAKVSDYEADHKLKKRKRTSASSKRDKLKELSERRKAKAAGRSGRRRGSESDEDEGIRRKKRGGDSDYYTDSDDSEDGHNTRRRGKGRHGSEEESDREESDEPPPLDALRNSQINRNTIVKIMHRPGWEKALTHHFIRFAWGPRKDEKGRSVLDRHGRVEEVFRIHEIEGTSRDEEHYYQLDEGKATNVHIKIRLFGKIKTMDMRFISNQVFSEKEYDRWVAVQTEGKFSFPSKSALERKQHSMRDFLDHDMTSEDVRLLLKEKKEALATYKASRGVIERQAPPPSSSGSTSANRTPSGDRSQGQGARSNNGAFQGRSGEGTKGLVDLGLKNRMEQQRHMLELERRKTAARRALQTGSQGTNTPIKGQSGENTPGHATPSASQANGGGGAAAAASGATAAPSSADVVASKLEAIGKAELASSAVMQVEVDLGDF